MPEPVEIVLVTSDQGAAGEAAQELSGTPGDEPLVSEKRGLDGGVGPATTVEAVGYERRTGSLLEVFSSAEATNSPGSSRRWRAADTP